MTDAIEPLDDATSWREDGARRAAAFQAAGKHSAHVRALKRTMVIGSAVTIVLLLVVAIFNPFRRAGVASFSVDGIGIDGSKVTMELPHLSGFRQDGRPYEMRAKAMVQDLHKPTAFDLTAVDGLIGMADKGSAKISAKTGYYDNAANAMDLRGDVHVKNETGFEAFLDSAHIDFKTNGLVSKQPVRVFMNTTTVTADGMDVAESGRKVIFNGHVKTHMSPAPEAAATGDGGKGGTP